jgi:DNA-binding CsgD family transcriptional regulator
LDGSLEESRRTMKAIDYREFDDLVGLLHRPPRSGSPLGAFLSRFGAMLDCATAGFFVYDARDRLISHGVSTPHRPINLRALAGWQKSPEIRAFNSRRFLEARRLSEFGSDAELGRQAWYRAQFTDAGLRHCLMQDIEVGPVRARVLALRALEAPDFDREECELFERAGFHLSTGLRGFQPDSLRGLSAAAGVVELDFAGRQRAEFVPAWAGLALAGRGLSAAERRVALALRDGRPVREAAERLGLSLNTVKTHLKRVYEKLGVRGLPELVALLARLETEGG